MKKIINDIRKNIFIFLFSYIESFLSIYGTMLITNNSLKNFNLILFILSLIISLLIFYINIIYISPLKIKYKNNNKYIFSRKNFIIRWFCIFILWIPVLLAYYPTLWAYDVQEQVPHIIGTNINTNQPILHTLFIELFLILGKKINSYEFGMLLLSLVQMLIMSCIFSYSIEKIQTYINNKLVSKIITAILIIYYAFIPFNSILSISMTKDVLFSGLFLVVLIYLYDFIDNDNVSIYKKVLYVVLSLVMLLIKNNMVSVYIIFFIITLLMFKKINKIYVSKLCFLSLIIYFIFNFCLINVTKAKHGDKVEKYSVLVQNLTYVAINHENKVIKDNMLYGIIDRECYPTNIDYFYDKNRADYAKEPIKECIKNQFSDYKLVTTWIKYGAKYPIEYIDSWSNLTIGSWYIFDESHANTYPGDMQGYLLTDFKSFKGLKLKRPDSKLPWLREKLELIATYNKQYNSNLIFRLLFVPATYILSFFLLVIYVVQNKLYNDLIPLVLPLILYISVLFGPVIIVRYIYPFMVIVPFMYFRLLTRKNICEKKSKT